jgi:hypothetical protein
MNVVIDRNAKARLWAFIKAVKVEVGGMGYAFLQDDGSLEWRDTFLIPQEVNSSEVDFETTGGDQVAIERAIADGVLDDPRFVWVSWHSHHTMKAFWSTTDDARIAAMSKVGITRMLSLVGCHDGEYKMRFDVFGVEAHEINIGQVTISNVTFEAEGERELSEFEQSIKDEIEANVVKKASIVYHSTKKDSSKALTGGFGFNRKDKDDEYSAWPNDERRVVQELVFTTGSTKQEAEDLVKEVGLDEAEDLLEGYYRQEMA